MAYSNAAAVFRGDIAGVLEQSKDWENGLIGTKVMPVLNVPVRAGQYPTFLLKEAQLLKQSAKQRAVGGAYPRATQSFNQDTYTAIEYGIENTIDDVVTADMARFFDAEVIAGKLSQRSLMLAHELRAAAKIFDNTVFTATNSATAYTAANLATFDFGADVDDAKDRLLAKGESIDNLRIVISAPVYSRIKASTKFQNRLRGAGVSSDTFLNVGLAAAAEALGVQEVLIGRSSYDSANEGAAFSSSNIWSNTLAWVGSVSDGGAGYFGGGAGFTLNWSEYGPVIGVTTYRDETIRSNVVRSSHFVAEKIVNSNAAQLITTQYS